MNNKHVRSKNNQSEDVLLCSGSLVLTSRRAENQIVNDSKFREIFEWAAPELEDGAVSG